MLDFLLILILLAFFGFSFIGYLLYKEVKLAEKQRMQACETISKFLPEIQADLQNFVCEYVKPKD